MFINIVYIYTSDYNRLNYGKIGAIEMLLHNLQQSIGLERMPPSFPLRTKIDQARPGKLYRCSRQIYRYISILSFGFLLMCKDTMVIFNQSLSDPQYVRVLKEAQKYASGLHMSSNRYPVGETSVPSSDP